MQGAARHPEFGTHTLARTTFIPRAPLSKLRCVWVFLLIGGVLWPTDSARAARYTYLVDPAASEIKLLLKKRGWLSAFASDHVLIARLKYTVFHLNPKCKPYFLRRGFNRPENWGLQ